MTDGERGMVGGGRRYRGINNYRKHTIKNLLQSHSIHKCGTGIKTTT